MVIRGGGQLNLSVSGQFTVHGEHVPHVFVLRIEDVVEVGEGVVPVLHEQVDEAVVAMRSVVVPLNVIG